MIPRFKAYLGTEELRALFQRLPDAVNRFEMAFAHTFETSHAIAFPYGRSALWTLFKALGITNAEVIMPAYTCDVVAHAVVLSGNIPRFVDVTLFDYNMDLDRVADAINERTRAIIATHLFGYPLDTDGLNEIVSSAEKRLGQKIWVIQDCAHSFGASWNGKLVCNEGDAALFGLNISKQITSIFGGMLTSNDADLADQILKWRNTHYSLPNLAKSFRRILYLLAVYPAFNETVYGLVNWLQEKTPFLDYLTKAYHLDNKIHFPPDFQELMLPVEARVGLVQLDKYDEIIQRRRAWAAYYSSELSGYSDRIVLPPLVEGATYSHYTVRLAMGQREPLLAEASKQGVQLGSVVDYVVPEMKAYQPYDLEPVPNSSHAARTVINLPLHVTDRISAKKVVEVFKSSVKKVCHERS